MPRVRHRRQPRDVVTERRAEELVAFRVARRLNGAVGLAMTVVEIIGFMRGMLDEELPTLARQLLRWLGLDYTDDDDLSIEGFQGVLSRQTGIEFTDITSAQAIKEDIESYVLDRIEAATGMRFSAINRDTMRDELLAEIEARVTAEAQGVATDAIAMWSRSLPSRIVRAAREAHRAGFDDSLGASMATRLRRWNHREAQKRYEALCVTTWKLEDMVTRGPVYGRVRVILTGKQVARLWNWNRRHVWGRRVDGLPEDGPMRYLNRLDSVGIDWRFPAGAQQKYLTLTEANKARIRAGLRPLTRSIWDGRKFRDGNIRGR